MKRGAMYIARVRFEVTASGGGKAHINRGDVLTIIDHIDVGQGCNHMAIIFHEGNVSYKVVSESTMNIWAERL